MDEHVDRRRGRRQRRVQRRARRAERGRRVLLLERGEPGQAGGNSYYTAGAVRIAHGGLSDLATLLDPDDRHATTVLAALPRRRVRADMAAVTEGRNDPALTEVLIAESRDALAWLHDKGLRYRLMYERQAYPDAQGRHVFWGGLAVGSTGGGKGLIEQHTAAAAKAGVEVRYGVRVRELVRDGGAVGGRRHGTAASVAGRVGRPRRGRLRGRPRAAAALPRRGLAAGEGARHPAQHRRPAHRRAGAGAAPYGDWSSCHSVAWDAWHAGQRGRTAS